MHEKMRVSSHFFLIYYFKGGARLSDGVELPTILKEADLATELNCLLL
jgi:hypothetical protein